MDQSASERSEQSVLLARYLESILTYISRITTKDETFVQTVRRRVHADNSVDLIRRL